MPRGKITVEARGHILLIGLNRPHKRNAFDPEMFMELALAYGELDRQPAYRCGVLFAHGDHFTGGLDLPRWQPYFAKGQFPELPEGALDPMGLDDNRRLSKPMVMAVQGICLTIGLELMLATDIRIAATDTRFAQIEIKRGIYPVGGATLRLHQEVGWGNAMRYLLTADEMTADTAFRMGLVQELAEPGNQLVQAIRIAKTIAEQAPLGVQATLRSARIARSAGEKTAAQRLLPDLMPLMNSEDVAEGVRSFIERRKAEFKGR